MRSKRAPLPKHRVWLTLLLFLASCVGPAPKDDYSLAFVALEAARATRAERYAPGLLNQAEDLYREAILDYENRRYQEARNKFLQARQYAEKAENYAVLKKADLGEVE